MTKHRGRLMYYCNKCKGHHYSESKVYEDHWDSKSTRPWERSHL